MRGKPPPILQEMGTLKVSLARALLLCSIIFAPAVDCTLTIHFTLDGPSTDYATAPFIYYGPQSFPTLENVPVIFLASDLCHRKVDEMVAIRGSIVIMSKLFNGCDLAENYDLLNRAGALALIRVGSFSKTPGLFAFAHSDLKRSMYTPAAGGLMPFMEISGVLVGRDLDRWEAGALETATATLSSDHEEGWAELFRAPLWTVSMRIFLPCFAAAAVAVAAVEAGRRWSVPTGGFWICIIQACTMILVGVELACGGYGPTMLPFRFHYAMWFKLSGMSVFATTLLAVVLREKARALRQLPLVDAYTAYRRRIWLGLAFLLSLDVAVGLSLSWPGAQAQRDGRVVILVICALESAAAAFYIHHSLGLVGALRGHLSNQVSKPVPELINAVARLTWLLKISVLGMALTVVALLLMMFLLSIGADPNSRLSSNMRHLWFLGTAFLFSFSRVLISLAQVLIVRPYNAKVKVPPAFALCAKALCAPHEEDDGGNDNCPSGSKRSGRAPRVLPALERKERKRGGDRDGGRERLRHRAKHSRGHGDIDEGMEDLRSFDSSISSKDYFDTPEEVARKQAAKKEREEQQLGQQAALYFYNIAHNRHPLYPAQMPWPHFTPPWALQQPPWGPWPAALQQGTQQPGGQSAPAVPDAPQEAARDGEPVFMYIVACDGFGRPVRTPVPFGQVGSCGPGGSGWPTPLQPQLQRATGGGGAPQPGPAAATPAWASHPAAGGQPADGHPGGRGLPPLFHPSVAAPGEFAPNAHQQQHLQHHQQQYFAQQQYFEQMQMHYYQQQHLYQQCQHQHQQIQHPQHQPMMEQPQQLRQPLQPSQLPALRTTPPPREDGSLAVGSGGGGAYTSAAAVVSSTGAAPPASPSRMLFGKPLGDASFAAPDFRPLGGVGASGASASVASVASTSVRPFRADSRSPSPASTPSPHTDRITDRKTDRSSPRGPSPHYQAQQPQVQPSPRPQPSPRALLRSLPKVVPSPAAAVEFAVKEICDSSESRKPPALGLTIEAEKGETSPQLSEDSGASRWSL